MKAKDEDKNGVCVGRGGGGGGGGALNLGLRTIKSVIVILLT